MNNVFDDLRSSKILDIYHGNVTKEINFATCSTGNKIPNEDHCDFKNVFFIESMLIYTNSNKEANAEDQSLPNYEQF